MRFRSSLALLGIALSMAACTMALPSKSVSEMPVAPAAPAQIAPQSPRVAGDTFAQTNTNKSTENSGAATSVNAAYSTSAPDAQLPRLDRMVVSSVNLTISVDNAVN